MMKRIFLAGIIAMFAIGSRRCAGNLRNQGRQQGWQAARRRSKNLVHEEVHDRDLRGESGGFRRQKALRCRQDQLHEEVRERRITAAGQASIVLGTSYCHQRRWRRRSGSGTGAGGGKANRSAFCRHRSHSLRVSVSCCPQQFGDGTQGGYLRFQYRCVVLRHQRHRFTRAGLGRLENPLQFGGVNHQATGFTQRQSGHGSPPRYRGGRSAPAARSQATVNEGLPKSVDFEAF